jgi:hypothetical protein
MYDRLKLIADLPFVAFPGAITLHRLDPDRPGQTMCGRDVDPWSVEFLRSGGCDANMCEQCIAAANARQRERN